MPALHVRTQRTWRRLPHGCAACPLVGDPFGVGIDECLRLSLRRPSRHRHSNGAILEDAHHEPAGTPVAREDSSSWRFVRLEEFQLHAARIPEARMGTDTTLIDFVRGCTFDDFLLRPQFSVLERRDPATIDLTSRFSEHITLK